jgi:hypothetical protein
MEGGEEDNEDNEDNADLPARQQYVLLLKQQYEVPESRQSNQDYFRSISLLQVEQLDKENREKNKKREYSL